MVKSLLDEIHMGQEMTSPSFGTGKVVQILSDGFCVMFAIGQFVYKSDGGLYPNGKKQSVFIKQ